MDSTEDFDKKIIDEESKSYSGAVGDSEFVLAEEVEIRNLNRHERRKRAKLARQLAVKERLEMEAKSSKLIGKVSRND
jgi:hypothetical protein